MVKYFHTVARKCTWTYSLCIRNENFEDNCVYFINMIKYNIIYYRHAIHVSIQNIFQAILS